MGGDRPVAPRSIPLDLAPRVPDSDELDLLASEANLGESRAPGTREAIAASVSSSHALALPKASWRQHTHQSLELPCSC